jgi:hypothetical protein
MAPLESAAIAKSLRQVAPAPTGTGHPEDRIHKASVIGSRAALAAAATGHQGASQFRCTSSTRSGSRSSDMTDLSSQFVLNPTCIHSGSIFPSSARGFMNKAALMNEFSKNLNT